MNARPQSPRSLRLPFILMALIPAVSGCTPSTGQVERGIERELPRVIGPAESYAVQIEGLRARSGEAERVVAVGRRVRPEDAPVVDRIQVELRNVHYDRRQKRLERVESARATALVTAADLAAFLEEQENIQSASVTLQQPNQARIQLRPNLGGLTLPGATVDVTGEIVSEGSQIRFVVSEVTAAGVRLGDEATQRISRLINPLVDLSGMPIPFQVREVQVEDRRIRLEATGEVTGLSP